MTSLVSPPVVGAARVRPRDAATGTYAALLRTVRDAGLLKRRVGFYATTAGVLAALTVGVVAGMFLLGDSWWQLALAGVLGIVLTQFSFLAHEASHRQVFTSGPANDRAGRWLANGVVGISYSWWMNKHTRHHANPNKVGADPDISFDTISFTEEDAATKSGWRAVIIRRQGWLFFPLLTLEGLNLHVTSIKSLISDRREGWVREIVTIAVRLAVYLGLVFWLLPPGIAAAFVGVHLAVFGVYMGASFAPNHKGMLIIPHDSKLDFLSRQVLTSRNIMGGRVVPDRGITALYGGLNYQVEHHLFPSMPRPHLARAREIVREHCASIGMPYTETTALRSYGMVVRYLNRVGLAARDPFDCPTFRTLRKQ
ncbi:fatty acid desaturase family protein [Luteimicrobium subarcticum]|uniref:Fatty acid desaturase n=1 Tax=Luteimicrobium subarcticum TaxID=620910 RepID=A0A2M8WRP9_9MICO|nr:fatty acid desaturase [Luteimicrobium subarcticum]